MNITAFTVEGHGPFPMSMLRFDNAWPARDDDASAIERSFERGTGKWSVKLYTVSQFAPTIARWNSFNARVVEIES